MDKVSVLIPARNEIYLEKTIRNILENAEGDIEILVALDGYLPAPPFDVHDNRVIFYPIKEAVGHRAATNLLAREAKGKFIMKIDAHCAVDKGFDVKLAADCEYDWTVIPRMYNLDIETWKPKLFESFNRAVRLGKLHDYLYMAVNEKNELRAEYYKAGNVTLHQSKKDILIDDAMCGMGPCFFMHKDRFFEQGGCDEWMGKWGQQAVEVACKAWLSGGSLKVNKKTWFAHWFRHALGWPYPISAHEVNKTRRETTDFWLTDKWPLAKRKFQWLVDKFDPPGWKKKEPIVQVVSPSADLTVIFLTMNKMPKRWAEFQMGHLLKAIEGFPVISVSREPMDFGINLIQTEDPSYWNIYRQILRAAKLAKTPYIGIAEDDTLYTREHFSSFRPTLNQVSYNMSRWSLFSWNPLYSIRQHRGNFAMIGATKVVVDALAERDAKYPNGHHYAGEIGRRIVEKKLGVSQRDAVDFHSRGPIVNLDHESGIDKNSLRRGRLIKRHGCMQAHDIPYWGKAVDIAKIYLDGLKEES